MFVQIQKPLSEELQEVKQLLYDTWVDTYAHIYSPETINKVTSAWHSLESLADQNTNPEIYFAVAKENDKIIGIVSAHRDGEAAVITKLYIHRDHQRKGIGKMLFDEALQSFSQVSKVRLEVEKANPKAMAFYKKLGFNEVGTKQDSVEGDGVECTIMEKQM